MTTSYLDKEVTDAIKALSLDGVVAYPTDTLYGLGAIPSSKKAIERIYAIKKRPSSKPLPLLIASPDLLTKFAKDPPPLSFILAKYFWPGPLTLILNASKLVPETITSGSGKIGLRVPHHVVAQRLAYGCGGAITGTSANISGGPNPRNAKEVRSILGDQIDHVLDGGECSNGVSSTILDLTTSPPTIIRIGAITQEEIHAMIGNNPLKGLNA